MDAPFVMTASGTEDKTQLECLHEALVNLCAHSDYFSAMHPTIRAYDDKIAFQNPSRFLVDLKTLGKKVQSAPRNPNISRFFRFAKLAENVGYGMDKMLRWKQTNGGKVEFYSELSYSEVTFHIVVPKMRL